jgi:hypothetical protein
MPIVRLGLVFADLWLWPGIMMHLLSPCFARASLSTLGDELNVISILTWTWLCKGFVDIARNFGTTPCGNIHKTARPYYCHNISVGATFFAAR